MWLPISAISMSNTPLSYRTALSRRSNNVDWCGSIASRSFEMLGGGTGGLHYDEALGMVGPPISFRIARYIEDVRE